MRSSIGMFLSHLFIGCLGWLLVQFLVERSLEKRLRTSHPYLVYGPASHGHDEEYRMPPGMSHPVAIEHIAPVIDSSCRALLDNATIMSTIRVRAAVSMLDEIADASRLCYHPQKRTSVFAGLQARPAAEREPCELQRNHCE